MKKSKILMPLTGIAAIGAIAPVAVLTACNKGGDTPVVTEDIFSDVKMTNEGLFGADELTAAAATTAKTINLPLTLTLKNDPIEEHKWYHTIEAQGKGQEGGTKLYLNKTDITEVTGTRTSGEKVFTGNLVINVNDKVTLTKDETTEFKVTYTEKDKDNKVVATQIVTYKVTAFATKYSCPTASVVSAGFTGSVALASIATAFPLSGIELSVNPLEGLQAELDESVLALDDQTSKYTLTVIKTIGTTTTNKAINFNATIAPKSGTTAAAGTCKFDINEQITIKFNDTKGKYVKDSWTVKLTTKKLITVTITA